MLAPSFHVTIGTSPDSRRLDGGGISLKRDLELTKAALLYADRATLVSPSSSMLIRMAAFADLAVDSMSKKQRFDFMAEMGGGVPGGEVFEQVKPMYHVLRKKKHLSKQERLLKLQLEAIAAKAWRDMRNSMLKTLADSGGEDLVYAIGKGHLHLHPLQFSDPESDGSADEATWAFIDAIVDAVKDSTTYLLLDDGSGGLVRAYAREGHFGASQGGTSRGRQVALAASLFERLPQFDLATLNETLDLRSELERHLDRFRAAMATYSDTIGLASWDEGFADEATGVFVREVAPAVRDIEDAVASNSYMRALTSRFAGKLGGAVPVLSLALTQALSLPDIAGLAAAGASIAGDAYLAQKEFRDGQIAAEQNRLFFYYAAGEALSRR